MLLESTRNGVAIFTSCASPSLYSRKKARAATTPGLVKKETKTSTKTFRLTFSRISFSAGRGRI
jgi:hypothetical protein